MFKKGYTMFIHSWENDWDAHNNTKYHFTELNEVKFYLEWLELFRSKHNKTYGHETFGNSEGSEHETKQLIELTINMRKKYGLLLVEKYGGQEFPIDDVWLEEKANEMLGSSEWLQFRVFENAEVYYFDNDIKPLAL